MPSEKFSSSGTDVIFRLPRLKACSQRGEQLRRWPIQNDACASTDASGVVFAGLGANITISVSVNCRECAEERLKIVVPLTLDDQIGMYAAEYIDALQAATMIG